MMEGYTYHLTHRCHNHAFLLHFARDRDAYRRWLRTGVNRYKVSVFAYSITSNHVHLVVHVRNRDAVARLMDLAAGATARQYNRRKGRGGAFREGKYHATAVEGGVHMWSCLRYDVGLLVQRLDGVIPESFREAYAAGIDEHIERQRLARETAWTEGLAVGSRSFAERVARETGRVQLNYAKIPSPQGYEGWCVRESPETVYGAEISPENSR
jgi:putative transposase